MHAVWRAACLTDGAGQPSDGLATCCTARERAAINRRHPALWIEPACSMERCNGDARGGALAAAADDLEYGATAARPRTWISAQPFWRPRALGRLVVAVPLAALAYSRCRRRDRRPPAQRRLPG